MATTAEPKKSFDDLKKLPVIDKIIVILNMLDGLKLANIKRANDINPITKKQLAEQIHHKAKASAFDETSTFLTQLFGDELREKLMPDESKIIIQ